MNTNPPHQFKFPSLENPVDVIVDRERWQRSIAREALNQTPTP